MASITRGTTPSPSFTVPLNLEGYTCQLSIGLIHQPWLTVDNAQMSATYGESSSTLVFTLTQKQTLRLKAGKAYVQLRLISGDTALATHPAEISIVDIVKDGVITDEY